METTKLDEESQEQMPPWAQGDKLRNVERDVLIPRIMRERAKLNCKDLVDGEIFMLSFR